MRASRAPAAARRRAGRPGDPAQPAVASAQADDGAAAALLAVAAAPAEGMFLPQFGPVVGCRLWIDSASDDGAMGLLTRARYQLSDDEHIGRLEPSMEPVRMSSGRLRLDWGLNQADSIYPDVWLSRQGRRYHCKWGHINRPNTSLVDDSPTWVEYGTARSAALALGRGAIDLIQQLAHSILISVDKD